ncbi:uncharacterized protein An01g15060 [Aspergillus niger]|uniref:Contig An01c0490, genomic contig n=2 Tax=Aspergillus niger TaxID=5061 RepID=A2QBF5_ASPNC|nr:uncharacterized protein An01g15060 [Aspergillus niger]CAK37460.1 unnamed protein product [Aspergillus niger]
MYRCRYTNKRDSNYTTRKATLACVGLLAVMGGLEALLILTLRWSQIPNNKGITWPDILVGAIATVLLAGGMLPIYFELGKRQGRVIGINWVFLCIDTLGGLFSIFALVAQGSFDILGGVMYIVVVVLELGIYLSHIIWRIRFREARKEAKHSGRSVEDILQMSNPA